MKKPTLKQSIAIGVIALFCAVFLWGRSAEAGEVTLGLGLSTNEARTQMVTVTTDRRDWYLSAARVGGDERHDYQFGRFAVGYRVNWRADKNFSPFMKLGAVYFTEEPTDYISDRWAYDMVIGTRFYDIVELEYLHNSTAGRSSQNEGLDTVMLSVVLPF